ncbi:hypothetical protein MNEG_11000 [Monoraphidium neglectum]|uniref:Uncharacterized protein n=1 Tax=Monoraphidium neglectum TaxID=145388 RepID=A0A0D2JB32_9CHLO|nr:hypothetical protein MNEG_11000 [Monoraphidium neglectum]KIY96962.1 hypothetical protein MNEG_11000 [Monoraphidium neglectum]|eukprot:XP_013895982.1 hypothetical protein MNEG_11000 [Monoraphidium neglectum]
MAAAYAAGVAPGAMRSAVERLAAGARRVAVALADCHRLAALIKPEAYTAFAIPEVQPRVRGMVHIVEGAEEEAFELAEWALGGGFRYAPARAAAGGTYSYHRLRYDLDDLVHAVFAPSDALDDTLAGDSGGGCQGDGGGGRHGSSEGGDGGSDVLLAWEGLERLSFAPYAANELWQLVDAWRAALAAEAAVRAPRTAAQVALARLRAMQGLDLGERMEGAAEAAERLSGDMARLWASWQATRAAGFEGLVGLEGRRLEGAAADQERAAAGVFGEGNMGGESSRAVGELAAMMAAMRGKRVA